MNSKVIDAAMCLCIASMIVSCQQVQEMDPANGGNLQEAGLLLRSVETKTVNSGMHTLWSDGDAVSVFYGGGAPSRFSYVGDDYFKGFANVPDGNNDVYVIYPHSESCSSAQSVVVNVSSTAVQQGNGSMAHLSGPGFPLFGSASGVASTSTPEVQMQNILAVVKFDITNTEDAPLCVTGIEFSAPYPLTGSFSSDITAGELEWSPVAASNNVNVSVENGALIEKNQSASFYAGVMPFSGTGTFSIKVYGKSSGVQVVYEKTISSKQLSFAAGSVNTLNVDFERSGYEINFLRVDSAPADGDWSGKYLVVDLGMDYVWNITQHNDDAVSIQQRTLVAGNIGITFEQNGTVAKVMSTNSTAMDCVVRFENTGYEHTNIGAPVTGNDNQPEADNLPALGALAHRVMNSKGEMVYYSSGLLKHFYSDNRYYNYLHAFIYNSELHCVEMASGGTGEWQATNRYYLTLSGTNEFAYLRRSYLNRDVIPGYVLLYKLDETSENPFHEQVFNLENPKVGKYLDEAYECYTDENLRTLSVVQNYNSGTNFFPEPVSLALPGGSGVQKDVTIFSDAACTNEVRSLTVSTNTVNIYNLVPGLRYYYTVSVGGETILERSFKTEGRIRMIKVSGEWGNERRPTNVRDLGGHRTYDGKIVNYGRIYRGSNFDDATAQEKAILTDELNIGLDIDLRTQTANIPNNSGTPVLDQSKCAYINPGFVGWLTTPESERPEHLTNEKLYQIFNNMIETLRTGKSVYFHCQAGADRTGIVAMLLQLSLGVTLKECSIDYEMTSFSIHGLRRRDANFQYCYPEIYNYITDNGTGTLQQKAEKILLDIGITAEQISYLKSVMLSEE